MFSSCDHQHAVPQLCLIMNIVAVNVHSSVLPDIRQRTEICSWNFLCILMYLPCITYSLLFTPTKAQHIYIYTYINNILYNISTATRFNTSASSSGSFILLFCYKFSTTEVKDDADALKHVAVLTLCIILLIFSRSLQ
jgi:hypothetical protein